MARLPAIRGDDRLLDDLDAPLPLRDTRLLLLGAAPPPLDSFTDAFLEESMASPDVFLTSKPCPRPVGTGELELVGVWVREGFREDFRVSGDCNIRCFHSSSLFIDSSL